MSHSQAGQKFVCHGAPCRCTHGTAPSPLQVSSQQNVFLQGKLKATALDQPVAPFGTCALKNNNACVPALLAWQGVKQNMTVGNEGGFPLLEKSTVRCAVGGVVRIVHTLQVEVPAPPATPAQLEAGRQAFQALAPVALLPLPEAPAPPAPRGATPNPTHDAPKP